MPDKDLAFTLAEFESRLERLRERLSERGVAGMLIHTPENIYYLSGFQTPGYYAYQTLLVPEGRTPPPVLVLRRLEEANVNTLSWIDARRGYVYSCASHTEASSMARLDAIGLFNAPLMVVFPRNGRHTVRVAA